MNWDRGLGLWSRIYMRRFSMGDRVLGDRGRRNRYLSRGNSISKGIEFGFWDLFGLYFRVLLG